MLPLGGLEPPRRISVKRCNHYRGITREPLPETALTQSNASHHCNRIFQRPRKSQDCSSIINLDLHLQIYTCCSPERRCQRRRRPRRISSLVLETENSLSQPVGEHEEGHPSVGCRSEQLRSFDSLFRGSIKRISSGVRE